jgi:hypothetical membrane protein
MNASLILQGVLIAAGAIWLRLAFPAERRYSASRWLLVASGFGVALVGLAPEDVAPTVHYAAAAEHFLTSNAALILLGAVFLTAKKSVRWVGILTLACGGMGLTATLLLAMHASLGLGLGAVERIAIYPFTLWLIGAGLVETLTLRKGNPRTETRRDFD